MKDKKYFCYEIFKNIAVWSSNEKIRYTPCSYSEYTLAESNKLDLSEVWNSKNHLYLKNLINKNLPLPGCERCYHEERNGLASRRLNVNDLYENYFQDIEIDIDAPQSIDYSIGNLCNLKCVICGPQNSTAWVSDYQKIYPKKNISFSKFNKFNQIELDDPAFLKNLKNIHFHGGGEPLLSSSHVNVLKKVKEIKGLTDVHVFYNTNGTKTVDQEVLDLWAECRLVELYFSLDDIGERFEYQRTGAKWVDVEKTIQWFTTNISSNHMFKINCTWSYLNIYYLDEIVEWHRQHFSTNRLGDPVDLIFQKAGDECEVTHLPVHVKQLLINKFQQYPELIKLIESVPESEEQLDNFIKYISALDAVRSTRFDETFNEFFLILNR